MNGEKNVFFLLRCFSILFVGFLLGLALMFFITSNNIFNINKYNKFTNEIKLDSYLVRDLISNVTFDKGNNELLELYKDKKVLASDLSSNYINLLVLKKTEDLYGNIFSDKELNNVKKFIFGENTEIELANIDKTIYKCGKYSKDNLDKKYIFKSEATCNYDLNKRVLVYLDSVEYDKENLYIYQRVGLEKFDNNNHLTLYNGVLKDSKELNVSVGNENKKLLQKYKLSFKYNEKDNMYSFVSSEIVK